MMYSEFLKGTGASESNETYEQFKVIEKIYMYCCQMSKSEAYGIWKKTYGKEMKLRRKKMLDRADKLTCTAEEFDMLPDEDRRTMYKTLNELFWAAFNNKDGSSLACCPSGRCFTDSYGIAWFVRHVGNYPNGSAQYGLYALVDGKVRNAHYIGL